jgi:hypothetical protein
MKKIVLLLLCLAWCLSGFSQQPVRVSGAVADSLENTSLPGVNVILKNLRDTTRIQGIATDVNGQFQFSQVRPGRYLMRLSYTGYAPLEKRIFVRGGDLNLGTLKIAPSVTTLKGVEVEGTAMRVEQKEDTIQYNATAFKTNPDATAEDLLTKMPGITVDETGVKAQGENVKQILLDGKKFFGDDPNIALRNLPAEIIDKVEVFDQLSEQSQFTGFDDGDTQKTINIRTKRGMSNGQFGKVSAGAGENDRYLASGNYNSFNGARKVTLLGLSNNVNQQNFSTDDLLGVAGNAGSGRGGGRGGRGGGGGGGGQRGGGSGGDAGNFLLSQQSGLSTTNSGGLNYINEWGKKVELSGSYFFNTADNRTITDLSRNYISRDSGMTYIENNNARSSNTNHRVNFRLRYDIDSANSIVVTPRLSMQLNNSNSATGSFSTIGETRSNQLDKTNGGDNSGYNFSSDVLYRHRFGKPGRSLSWRLSLTMNDRDGEKHLQSFNQFFDEGLSTLLDQQSTQVTNGRTYSSNLAYTERLGEHGQLQFNYTASLSNNNSDKRTYDLDPETKEYTEVNTELTNVFDNQYVTNRGGVSYRYNMMRKYNFMAGINFQDAQLTSDQDFPEALHVRRSFQNVLPNASMNYRFSRDANLRISYRTSTDAPSVSQLQNVIDNSNPLFLRGGNASLKQDYEHSLTLRYGKTNAAKARTFLFFVYGRYVKNYIGNATFYNGQRDTVVVNDVKVGPGQQLTYPVNVPENWNARTFVTYGIPLEFMKSNLNFHTGVNYTRSPALINDAKNLAHNYGLSQGVVLSSNISEQVDFTLSYTANYTIVKNSLESSQQADDNYFTHVTSLRVVCQPWKGLDLSSNVTNSFFSGLSSEYDQSIWFWNAAIGYKLLKDRALEIKLSAFDLLNQNKSINRDVTETYIEDSRTNVLTRYFMLTAVYSFRKFGG